MKVLVVLVPGFSQLSLGAILEPLNTLAQLSPDTGLTIDLATITEAGVMSASGVTTHCPVSFQECIGMLTGSRRPDALFLCCGLRTPYASQKDIQKLLRATVRARVALYGVGCAAWKMADAGILREGQGTVHWSTLAAFAERHDDIKAEDALFVTSKNTTSSPGEAATLDMVIEFIAKRFSRTIARQVCDHLMISYPRRGDLHQPSGQADRTPDAPKSLIMALNLMSGNLEKTLKIKDIAKLSGVSLRHLERLFSDHLSTAPKAYYIYQRLRRARLLIEQTSMSILEISIACGFSSRRVFTKFYKREFGFSPMRTRRTP